MDSTSWRVAAVNSCVAALMADASGVMEWAGLEGTSQEHPGQAPDLFSPFMAAAIFPRHPRTGSGSV